MRKWFAVGLFLSGTSLVGCGDENAGPGVGPDTSWQIFPAEGTGGTGQDAHGPLSGSDEDDKADDQDIKVTTCRHDSAGLQLVLEDPGEDDEDAPRTRDRSVLSIANVNLSKDQCVVTVTEYDDSAQLKFVDRCKGNSTPGTCKLDLDEDSDGYALNGTLRCDDLKLSSGNYVLRKAREEDEDMQLQIAHCN